MAARLATPKIHDPRVIRLLEVLLHGVLALVSDIDRDLAKRTLDLIPPTISRVVATFSRPDDEQALCALYLALHVAEMAGDLAGIDPGARRL
jgi:hypothetical protein